MLMAGLNKEARMARYILVNNIPNSNATLHRFDCVHLGPEPMLQTASAERSAYDDGLKAIVVAASKGRRSFYFCGHCLKGYRDLILIQATDSPRPSERKAKQANISLVWSTKEPS